MQNFDKTECKSIFQQDEKKQFDILPKSRPKNKKQSKLKSKSSEHIITDKNWLKFNATYKYQQIQAKHGETLKSITIIKNYYNLCFKEIRYQSHSEYLSIYNEYKTLTKYCRALYTTGNTVKLYLNQGKARLIMQYYPGMI